MNNSDKTDRAFPVDQLMKQANAIRVMAEGIGTPDNWEGITAPKMRDAVRLLDDARALVEQASVIMGTLDNQPPPSLLTDIRDELNRRGISNSQGAREAGFTRQGFWSYLNNYSKFGPKSAAKLEAWLETSKTKPAKDV